MYNKLPVKERIELMKSYRKANKDMSYRDMVNDYNTSYEKFRDGGEFNDYTQPGPLVEQSKNNNLGMTGLMKSKIATEAHYGNPAALRMVSPNPNKYTFTGEEKDWKGNQASPAGSSGTHFMGSYGDQARPGLQEVNGKMQYFQNPPRNSKENFNFSRPEDAEYFAEHYKEVAPMMRNLEKHRYGGVQQFDNGGIKEDDKFDFSKTQQKVGPRVEEDLYSGLYNTVETPKNLSELPSYRAYTYGANQYYAPISHPQKRLKDVLAWDEKTGMNYQLNEKNYRPFKEIPMTGDKSANLRRFVMDVAGTKDTQTYDLNLNKEGKYIKPNTSESGRITDPSEIKQNVFKDLYAQNLYKYKGDKDIAFGATRDFVEKRVEPLLGEYHKFKYDPKHPEHYMALGAYGDTDLDVTRLVSNFVDAPMQNYFKNNNNVTQEDVNKIIKGEDVAKSIEEYRPALRDYFKVAKNLSSKDTDELINKSFNEYYQSQQPQKQRYGGIQKNR